jgi:hypothetical protein
VKRPTPEEFRLGMVWLIEQLGAHERRKASAPTNGDEIHRPRFVVRPGPSGPTENKQARKWTMRPTEFYVMDSLILYQIVGRYRTLAEAEAKAAELERRHGP